MNTVKRTCAFAMSGALACALLGSSPVFAQNNASEFSVMSMVSMLYVPLMMEQDIGKLSVKSVQASAKGLEVVVESSVNGSRHTFQFSQRMGQDFSQATVASVELVATASGQLLVASGKVLGIIPNEQGRALLHHSRNREPA